MIICWISTEVLLFSNKLFLPHIFSTCIRSRMKINLAEVEHSPDNMTRDYSFSGRQRAREKNIFKLAIIVDSEGFKVRLTWWKIYFYVCEVYFKFRDRDTERKRAHTCYNQLKYRTRFLSVFVNTLKIHFLSLIFCTIKFWSSNAKNFFV